MENIKVTVIIPVYNVEKYVKQCLESVINQTFKDIEIIVVNDGTKDNSIKIVEEYTSDKRIKIINKENGGLSSARNIGIKAAKGKYICFVDSDDFIDKSMIEELYNVIEETNSDVVENDVFLYDNKTGKIKERKNENSYCQEKGVYLYGICSSEVWNKIYKKDFLIKNGIFFEEGIIHEDDLFLIKVLLLSKRISNLHKNLYYYRINRPGSTMTDINLERRLKALEVIVDKTREYRRTIELDEFSILMLKILEIYYLIEIYYINNKSIEQNIIEELENNIKTNWDKFSNLEKEIIIKFLRTKIVNKKAFYKINLRNKFYWKNKIITLKGLKRILICKISKK